MPKFFVPNEQVQEDKKEIKIIGTDVNHLKNVLRAKVGDNIEITDNSNQKNYRCQIEQVEKEYIKTKIIEELQENTESKIKVTVYQGLPKAEKMELIIQKSVELGVYDITPVEMKRCIVKLKDKDKEKKIQRWQKISEVAAKQCGREIIPVINDIIEVKEISSLVNEYDMLIVAYEQEQTVTLKEKLLEIKKLNKEELKIAIVIGPEGGLDEKEVTNLKESGVQIVTLGKRILRTETVALQMLSVIMYELEGS